VGSAAAQSESLLGVSWPSTAGASAQRIDIESLAEKLARWGSGLVKVHGAAAVPPPWLTVLAAATEADAQAQADAAAATARAQMLALDQQQLLAEPSSARSEYDDSNSSPSSPRRLQISLKSGSSGGGHYRSPSAFGSLRASPRFSPALSASGSPGSYSSPNSPRGKMRSHSFSHPHTAASSGPPSPQIQSQQLQQPQQQQLQPRKPLRLPLHREGNVSVSVSGSNSAAASPSHMYMRRMDSSRQLLLQQHSGGASLSPGSSLSESQPDSPSRGHT